MNCGNIEFGREYAEKMGLELDGFVLSKRVRYFEDIMENATIDEAIEVIDEMDELWNDVADKLVDMIEEEFPRYVNKKVAEWEEEYFIAGCDACSEVNLADGYVSVWKTKEGNKVMVYSFFCPDKEIFYYTIFPVYTKDETLELLQDVLDLYDGFLETMGIKEETTKVWETSFAEYKNSAEALWGRCRILTDIESYCGMVTDNMYNHYRANTLYHVIKDIIS